MSVIRVLSKEVVNRIAAGEVIERPASVVKELIENSLDEGASRIQIWVEKGGKKSIKVTDNGVGMERDDLEIAFMSHSTSKLTCVEDLSHITSLGFRGEALASIGAVSEAKICSRKKGILKGHELVNRGGEIGSVREVGIPEGTTVEVRHLFFNLPAREKYLKTDQTELTYLIDMVTRFAIRHSNVHFELYHQDRKIFNLPPAQDFQSRLQEFFGDELGKNLLPVDLRGEWFHISGYISSPTIHFPNSRKVFFFLNDRFIRDRVLSHALVDGYSGAMVKGRYPAAFLLIQMDPAEVDVNVHPTKTEVRFRKSGAMHQALLMAVRGALEKARAGLASATSSQGSGEAEPGKIMVRESRLFQEPKRQYSPHVLFERNLEKGREPGFVHAPPREEKPFLQVHESFLIFETPDGFAVIDQHALHERVLYDQITEKLDKGNLPSQKLLIPEVVELSPGEAARILEEMDLLRRFGLEVVPFGDNAIALQSVPPFVPQREAKELIREIAGNLAEERRTRTPERLEKLKKTLACKGAVKAGESLKAGEVSELIQKAYPAPSMITCPHGRPAGALFSLKEIRKWFERR